MWYGLHQPVKTRLHTGSTNPSRVPKESFYSTNRGKTPLSCVNAWSYLQTPIIMQGLQPSTKNTLNQDRGNAIRRLAESLKGRRVEWLWQSFYRQWAERVVRTVNSDWLIELSGELLLIRRESTAINNDPCDHRVLKRPFCL